MMDGDQPKFTTLILGGGANRGIMYGGALQCLEEFGILRHIDTYIGTSVGALMATLLALGYTSAEIHTVIMSTNFKDVKPRGENEVIGMFRRYACYTNSKKERVIRDLINYKSESDNITFKQLYDVFKITLVITACCVETGSTTYMCHRNEPSMPIHTAVCMSTAIPLIFEPYTHNGGLYVDGGCFGHMFPVDWAIDATRTLGFRLVSGAGTTQITGIIEYLAALMQGVSRGVNQNSSCKHTIDLVCTVGALQETVAADVKHKLIRAAYDTTYQWLTKRRRVTLPPG
jgi:NTE family protein